MLREVRDIILYSILILVCLLIILGGLQAVGLIALPFVTHQQTMIFRQSNGYITAQQTALRSFMHDYEGASTGQKAVILEQMREIADLIPSDVQPDVRTFLATH
jgi:hypothetical protein